MSFPRNILVEWDANPAAENVTHYDVTLDGSPEGSPTGTSQTVEISAAGTYTVGVSAVNVWGESSPAQIIVVAVPPTSPSNLRCTVV